MAQKQAVINGLLINYYREGEGRPLIFLHGWRSDASVWLPLFPSLTPHPYALYALDLPGFGRSETPRTAYTLHDYAEIIKKFVSLIPNPSSIAPIIVGHSFGARIALKYAAMNPGSLQKLILIGAGGAREARVGIKKIIAKLLRPLFTPRFMQPLRRRLYVMIGADDYLATPHLQKTFVNILNEDMLPLAKKITVPTLIVWGEHDKMAPLAYGKKLHEAIQGSQLAIIKNTGHFCFHDQPEEFTEILQKFLK